MLEEFDENSAMIQGVQLWLNAHMFGQDASYTRKGLWYASQWGTLRNAALMASVALRAANLMDGRADGNGEVVNVRPPRFLQACAGQILPFHLSCVKMTL